MRSCHCSSVHISRKAPPLFELGRLAATPGALEALRSADMDARDLLRRHITGDWGDVGADDARENELSVREGFRILSSYRLATGVTVWIITEADRRTTTLLLSAEC